MNSIKRYIEKEKLFYEWCFSNSMQFTVWIFLMFRGSSIFNTLIALCTLPFSLEISAILLISSIIIFAISVPMRILLKN